MNKPTAVIGASPNPERYAFMATQRLKQHGHTVYPVGIHGGEIDGLKISTDKPQLADIHTVTLYVGPKNQEAWKEYIYSLKPKRIVFNPGAENQEFINEAQAKGIECIEACTLVMLSIGNY